MASMACQTHLKFIQIMGFFFCIFLHVYDLIEFSIAVVAQQTWRHKTIYLNDAFLLLLK